MRTIIQRIPVPLAGVMLGCAALGNLLQSYSEGLRYLLGGIAALLFIVLVLKLILFPKMIKEDLNNPILMSVSATFPMGMMLLSVYVKPFLGVFATAIWWLAIVLHLLLICMFSYRFLRKLDIKKVFASYYIVYVGIAVAGVTAPAHQMKAVGVVSFWFGLVSLIALLGLVGYRYLKHPAIPEPAQPLVCIFAAPASLCLAAYLQSVSQKSLWLVVAMGVLATILYLLSIVRLPSLLRLPFYPSYAAFTFPFVISAIAMKQMTGYLAGLGYSIAILPIVVFIETAISVVLVCYTLARFVLFLCKPISEKTTIAKGVQ